ncbi:MAG: type II and III secretion system protein, partial [Chloroflexi bacterium]|nr:type II and III secretion system protein [Chloroflexota bacterium]
FIGLQRYISTPVELPASAGSNYGQTLNFISAGVNLKITPLTGATGIIFTTLDTEVSVLGADDPTTHLPDKSTRHADTVVTVRDGQTIILGGLNQDEIHETRTKVPLLGDIPVIGTLFRTHSLQHTHTQLLILITPHVLSETGHLPAAEEQRLKEQFLGPAQNGSAPAPGAPVSGRSQLTPPSAPGVSP